jgi:hypothetical protein
MQKDYLSKEEKLKHLVFKLRNETTMLKEVGGLEEARLTMSLLATDVE